MDIAKKYVFSVFTCLFINIVDAKQRYDDDSDYSDGVQCHLRNGARAIFLRFW